MAILLPLSLASGSDALSLRDLPEVPISWMSKERPGPSGGYTSRVAPAGSECGGLSSEPAVWRGLAASCSCPPVSLRGLGRGGEEGTLCVPRAGTQPELLAGIAGAVGRGRLAAVSPGTCQPSAGGAGGAWEA